MAVQDMGRVERRIRIQTLFGMVEGRLRSSAMLRTLDELNVVVREFVTVHEPEITATGWVPAAGPVAINKSSILFVVELDAAPPRAERSVEAARFTRARVSLRVGDYGVQGFLHVPRGGEPISRLNQSSHPFLALTSASIVGPGVQFGATFLAVQRRHVLAAQEMAGADADPRATIEEEAPV